MTKLTKEECDIILDALDAWTIDGVEASLFTDYTTLSFSPDKEKAKKEIEEKQKELKKKVDIRKRQTIKLKAKILEIQESDMMNDLLEPDKD